MLIILINVIISARTPTSSGRQEGILELSQTSDDVLHLKANLVQVLWLHRHRRLCTTSGLFALLYLTHHLLRASEYGLNLREKGRQRLNYKKIRDLQKQRTP